MKVASMKKIQPLSQTGNRYNTPIEYSSSLRHTRKLFGANDAFVAMKEHNPFDSKVCDRERNELQDVTRNVRGLEKWIFFKPQGNDGRV